MNKNKQVVYIALLRGINVGGHSISMEKLRGMFETLGFSNVRSYIQSGNIFFESDETDIRKLQRAIEEQLEKSLEYTVPVCLRTIQAFEKLIEYNPFKKLHLTPDSRFAIMFLSRPSAVDVSIPFLTPDGGYEVIGKTGTELFVVWRLVNGRPGNSYGLLEKKLQVPTTTRFWHTAGKILQAAKRE